MMLLSPHFIQCFYNLLFLAVQWDAIFRSNNGNKFTVHTNMNPNIGLLRLFPGITSETVSNQGIAMKNPLSLFHLKLIVLVTVFRGQN